MGNDKKMIKYKALIKMYINSSKQTLLLKIWKTSNKLKKNGELTWSKVDRSISLLTWAAMLCKSCSIVLWNLVSLKQFPNIEPPKIKKTDWGEISSSDLQLLAFISFKLDGSDGNAGRLLQFCSLSSWRLQSRSKVLGNFPRSEQPERERVWRSVNLQMLLGRLRSFLQFVKSNILSSVAKPIEEGSSVTVVPSKHSVRNQGMCWEISESFSSFEQPERMRVSRDTNWLTAPASSSDLQLLAFIIRKLDGSVGNACRLLQFCSSSSWRL